MGKCECGRLKGNPCGPLRPNTINVTMPALDAVREKFGDDAIVKGRGFGTKLDRQGPPKVE